MSERPVALTASSPEQWGTRHGRHARRATAAVLAVAVVLVAALFALSPGSLLTVVVAGVLLVMAALVIVIRIRTGTWRPWEHVGTLQRLLAITALLTCTTCGARYLISLAVAPESPRSSLLWGLLTAVPAAAFIVWALRPVTRARRAPGGPV